MAIFCVVCAKRCADSALRVRYLNDRTTPNHGASACNWLSRRLSATATALEWLLRELRRMWQWVWTRENARRARMRYLRQIIDIYHQEIGVMHSALLSVEIMVGWVVLRRMECRLRNRNQIDERLSCCYLHRSADLSRYILFPTWTYQLLKTCRDHPYLP